MNDGKLYHTNIFDSEPCDDEECHEETWHIDSEGMLIMNPDEFKALGLLGNTK